MKYIIGVDIGGTKISVILGTSTGKILEKRIIKTRVGSKVQLSSTEISSVISGVLSRRNIKSQKLLGIGIGVPGPVDPKKEKIERSPNLPKWEQIPLRPILKRRFNCPVFIENDANAAALGEKYFGAGRSVSDFVYITVSTGIGSGIVTNGRLVRGIGGAAGEIGHTTVQIAGEKCLCGKRGCLEAYASGTAIAKFARRALKAGRKSKMSKLVGNINAVTGATVSQAANLGDHLAIEIRERTADYLGVGLGNLMNVLNPKRIILGGGVLENANHFWKPMMAAAQREAWPAAFKSCQVLRTKLGNRVGDYGALAIVLDRKKE